MSADLSTRHNPIQRNRPSDWNQVPLVSIADVRFSGVDKLSKISERPVRLCNYIDVYNNDYITSDLQYMCATATQSEIDRFRLKNGDVIITKDSETPDDIGISAVVDYTAIDLVCGYHLALLRPKADEVDPTFLAKQLRHHRLARYFGQRANGLTRYGLSTEVITKTPIQLPPLREQQIIGVILRQLDIVIAEIIKVITKLRHVRTGLLNGLLTYGVDEHGQLRDPVAHPEQFTESPLGRIPRDWDVLPLSHVAAVERGRFTHRPRNDPAFYGGSFPFIQTGDVALAEGSEISKASQTLNERGVAVSKEFPPGTIAVTIAANIGETAILGKPMYFPDSIVGVTPLNGYTTRWLELALRRAKGRLNAMAPQSAQKNINLEFLRPMLVPVPSIEEQEKCSRIFDDVSQRIEAEELILHKLNALKCGLMSDLLTGFVSVPEAIIEMTHDS